MKVVLATAPRALGEIEMAGLPFLGIGYIASHLERAGHQVVVTDAHSCNLTIEQTVDAVLSFNPKAVGFSATTHNRLQAIAAIKLLKRKDPSLLIIVGGPHFSLTAQNALETIQEIDCVIGQEGEATTEELLRAWPNYDKLGGVLGIAYRGPDGEIISNADRPFLKNLSTLSFPAWHLYNLSKYQKRIHGTDFRTIGVISSRGCPNHCTFCANAAFSKSTLRLRSPENFVDEVEMLNKKYDFEGFNFWDDTLTISKNHVLSICHEILKRGLDIKWYARARINTVDREMLQAMREAGCVRISFGIESGSSRILETIKKNIDAARAEEIVRLTSQMGFITSLNFIVNLPTETFCDLGMTVHLMKKLNQLPNVTASYGFALIYPGTEMESFAKKNGILPPDFSWNGFFNHNKARVIGEDPSVPYMEWEGKELERVKAFMVKNLVGKTDTLKKGWQKLKRVKSWTELRALFKIVGRYFKN